MALFDSITGDNDYRREARASKAAHEAAEESARENARMQRAMADDLEKQMRANEKARMDAAHQAFLDQLNSCTFAGSVQSVTSEMDKVYQIWISDKFEGSDKDKKSQKRLLDEKIEYGLMTLKGLDAAKGSYYENKINAEKLSRKKKARRKVFLGIVLFVVFLIVMAIGIQSGS